MDRRFQAKAGQEAPRAVQAEAPKVDLDDMAERSQVLLDPGRFAPKDEEALERLARRYYFSMKLPDSYYPRKYEDRWADWAIEQGIARAYIAMLEGDAIGIGPVMAIKHIHVIGGVSTLSADLMFGRMLATRVLRRDDFTLKADKTQCEIVIGVKTRPASERLVVIAKYDDFKHLHGKDNWRNDPEGMLVARAKSRACKRYAPDLFVGLYSREEMQDLADDRRAGVAVDVPSEMVPTDGHMQEPPTETVRDAEPDASAKPAFDREAGIALLKAIRGASDTIETTQIADFRARLKAFEETEAYTALVDAWGRNENLGPFEVPS